MVRWLSSSSHEVYAPPSAFGWVVEHRTRSADEVLMRDLGGHDRARGDREQVGNDVRERPAGIQLMGAAGPEEWLDGGKVLHDHRSFQPTLAVIVRCSSCDPVKDHVHGRAEQDHSVE